MKLAGVAVSPIIRRVEVFDDFGETPENRTMRFVENDQVKKAWAELFVTQAHGLFRGDKEALGSVHFQV